MVTLRRGTFLPCQRRVVIYMDPIVFTEAIET
jgi:hypothetical protein